eukprot:2383687-Pyramimonas_sp.AAC.1
MSDVAAAANEMISGLVMAAVQLGGTRPSAEAAHSAFIDAAISRMNARVPTTWDPALEIMNQVVEHGKTEHFK